MNQQMELVPEKQKGIGDKLADQSGLNETEKMINDTLAAIDQAGFCLWICSNMGGAVICVILDNEIEDANGRLKISWEQFMIMQEYPVYTLDELRLLSQTGDWTHKVVLDLKHMTGIEVYKVEIPRKRKLVNKK
jgi:hypothetical protein